MRIAHVTATFPPYTGGTGTVCYHNAVELARLGHEVTVFTAAVPLPPEHKDPDEITIRRLPAMLRMGNAPLLPALLRTKDFDIIHLHHPFIFGAEMIGAIARLRKIPYIVTHHNDLIGKGLRRYLFDTYSALFTRAIFNGASKFAVVSLDHAQHCRLTPLLQKRWRDVIEIPNGVDIDLFRPGLDSVKIRQKHGISEAAKVVLFVGALDQAHHFKGVEHLLRAFSQLQDTDTLLLIVGDGDLRNTFETLAEELCIASQVRFAGAQSHHHLAFYYNTADIAILPSFPPESFGVVLIEAMACGTPVIASNLPGVRTVVNHGEDGFLIEPGEVESLAAALRDFFALPTAQQREMGMAGRRKVEARYAWRSIGTRLEELYTQVVAASRQGQSISPEEPCLL